MQKHNPAVHQGLPASRILHHKFGAEALATVFFWVAITCALGSLAHGKVQSSTTTLSVSSGTVTAGQAVQLTATVTAQDPVTRGQVMFCAAAAAHCEGAALFGVAQLISNRTAAIKLTLGVGSYSIKAIYSGIDGTTGSTSTAHSLTVTGAANYASSTTLVATGSAGDYTLASQVTFFGKAAATGMISFLDASHSDSLVGSAILNPTTLADIMTPAPGSPLTAQNPQFVVSGDFNHDGIPDLAVTGPSSGTVGIYLGVGNGTFQSQVDYSVGEGSISMAVGDVNGDGNLDLIVVNIEDDTVSILLGNGDGTFQGQTTFATGEAPESVVVGDFNGDGWLDLAVANDEDSTVGILLGNGDGTFQPQVTYFVPDPLGIAVADFNHDGILDLAVTGVAQGAILDILLGVGDGTFIVQSFVSLPEDAFGLFLAAGDLRNNGTQDVVVPDLDSANVYVYLGNNDGTFQAPVTYPVAADPEQVVLGDVNGDGILDLVVPATGGCGCSSRQAPRALPGRGDVATADTPGNCGCGAMRSGGLLRKLRPSAPGEGPGGEVVSVWLGHGDGTFAAETDYPVGDAPTTAAVADFNGDGLLDIATSDLESNTATILLGARTETAQATGQAVYGTGVHNVLARYAGDVDRAPSQSATVPLTAIPQVVTSTVLAIAPNPAVLGQSVILTAAISPLPTGSPLGTVSFYYGIKLLGSGNVDSDGVATFTTTILPEGSDMLIAVYSGNTESIGSTSAAKPVIVHPAPVATSTALDIAPNPGVFGQSATLTATVSPPPTGSSLGTVSFYHGTTLLGSANVDSAGVATFTTKILPVGSDILIAVYSGNTGFAASTSDAKPATVKPAELPTYAVTAPATPFPVAPGAAVTIKITVPPLGGAFDKVVTLSATGLPADATATFLPPTVTPGIAGGQSLMTIQLATLAAISPASPIPAHRGGFPVALFSLASVLLGADLGRKRLPRALLLVSLLATLGVTAAMFTGCNGGFASSPNPAGTYRVTVTGTSGAFHASTTVTLMVQ
jgi:Bacterial Ig-like domain (group 3)/FG-GAP-like repeat